LLARIARMRLPLENLPTALLRAIADRAHRSHLHALNGKVQMLTLLASCGLETEQDKAQLNKSVQAFTGLTKALHQLWNQSKGLTPELALSVDWPQRLLLAALRDSTLEESNTSPPVGGGVAVATALWAEAIAGDADRIQYNWKIDDANIELHLAASPMAEPPSDLLASLDGWVSELAGDPHESTQVRRLRLHLPTALPEAETPRAASAIHPEAPPARD
jgi:hypothetical protein